MTDDGNELVTADQVRDLVRRQAEQTESRMARAMAMALRIFSPRREQPSGGITIRFGNVTNGYDGWAMVQFDNDTEPAPVESIGQVDDGARVAVAIIPPSGGLILGNGVGGGSGGGQGTPILATFSASGVVIPTTTSKLVPIGAADTIGSVVMTMGSLPLRPCTVEVFLDGVSLVTASFAPTDSNPVTTAITPTTGPGLVSCLVTDGGSGRDLNVFVMSD